MLATVQIDPVTRSGSEYRFANACLCAPRRELRVDGVPVALGARSFDLLQLLIRATRACRA